MGGAAEPKLSVGVAVITHNAQAILKRCLNPILLSSLAPRVVVVNSSSTDGTVELAARMGVETLIVPRDEFNHGLTRERARRFLGTDIVVMLTPDAWLDSEHSLAALIRPLRQGKASVAYARQLPRREADTIECYNRHFNYPSGSCLRSQADWPIYGAETHFCSNACAAWRASALDEIGGFPPTIVSEETVAAARLLERGHHVAYVADALVRHSHPAGFWRDFRRQFDTGFTRALYFDLLLKRERDEVRGWRYMRGLLRTLWYNEQGLLPKAIAHLFASYLGYRIGLIGPKLPLFLARMLSSQDFFWRSKAMRLTLNQAAG